MSYRIRVQRAEVAYPPKLSKERFQRAVETEYRVPAFAWDRLDPVAAIDTGRLLGAEINRRGAVGIRFGGG